MKAAALKEGMTTMQHDGMLKLNRELQRSVKYFEAHSQDFDDN